MELNNETLEEYMILSKEIRQKTKRLDEIKQACKERGTFFTEDYICAIDITTRQGLPSLEEVSKSIQRATLETLGLIRTIQVVSVKVICRPKHYLETPENNR